MKTSKLFIALCTLAAAVSCSKTVELAEPQAPEDQITIRVALPDDPDVKGAGLETKLSWTWNTGDKITVIGETTEIFRIKDGFSPKQAEFTGSKVKGKVFTILYPGEDATKTDWSVQTQKGNNSLEHLKYEAALENVDDYLSFSFSPEWAAAHGGTLKQVGVMKLALTLPDATGATSVTLSADKPVFNGSNAEGSTTDKLTLNLVDTSFEPGQTLVAWLNTSWIPATVPSGTTLSVLVQTDKQPVSRDIILAKDSEVKTGYINIITLDGKGWIDDSVNQHYGGGKGSKDSPWIIKTPAQLAYVFDDLAAGGIRYYKLGADIDMTGMEWTPLNAASPYDRQIDFDGDGHTISNFTCSAASYPSFFGVLFGECRNLNFKNATLNVEAASAGGILGGYLGTSGKPGIVNNVHVEGTINHSGAVAGIGGLFGKISGASLTDPCMSNCSFKGVINCTGGKNGIGGIVGTATNALIASTWADVEFTATGNYVGGILGYDTGTIVLRDCWSAGTIQGKERVGGIAGGLIKADSSIYSCYSTASVTATTYIAAGIAGHCNLDKKNANDTNDPKNHIEKCIAWNSLIKAGNSDGAEHYGSGIVVGYTALKNYLADCWHKNGIDFQECSGNQTAGYTFEDQANASPENPLVKCTGTYNFSYNGKTADAGKTLSQVAKDAGWSADVWDFSGELPKLK